MERTSVCVACEAYGIWPPALSVDPACRSKDEADALCTVHRARATEGACVLCGRRVPWVSPWLGSDIGACELCFRVLYGPAAGDQVAQALAQHSSDPAAD
jgi:hypothetical protein